MTDPPGTRPSAEEPLRAQPGIEPTHDPSESAQVRSLYVRRILGAYRKTPGTTGVIRAADRRLACDLHERGVSADAVETALLLASARRYCTRNTLAPPATVRSLAYFLPVINEVLSEPLPEEHRRYLAARLQRALHALPGSH